MCKKSAIRCQVLLVNSGSDLSHKTRCSPLNLGEQDVVGLSLSGHGGAEVVDVEVEFGGVAWWGT